MGRSQGGVGRSQGGGVRSQRGGYSIHVCCRSHLGRRGPCEHTFHQDIWQLLKKYFHSATSCTNHSHLVKFGNAGTKNVSRICDFNQQSLCGRGCFTNRLVKVTCLGKTSREKSFLLLDIVQKGGGGSNPNPKVLG